jgi:hypothetical protein
MTETLVTVVVSVVGLALIFWRALVGRRSEPPPIPEAVRRAGIDAARANIEAAAVVTEARTEEKTVRNRVRDDLAIKDEAERLRRLADGLKGVPPRPPPTTIPGPGRPNRGNG